MKLLDKVFHGTFLKVEGKYKMFANDKNYILLMTFFYYMGTSVAIFFSAIEILLVFKLVNIKDPVDTGMFVIILINCGVALYFYSAFVYKKRYLNIMEMKVKNSKRISSYFHYSFIILFVVMTIWSVSVLDSLHEYWGTA